MSSSSIKDRFLCALFYTTIWIPLLIWIPLIWVVVSNIQRKHMPEFLKYHCFQAVLFYMIGHFLPEALRLIVNFVSTLLSMMVVFDNTITLLQGLNTWFQGIYYIVLQLAALYAIIWTLRGKYTYIPPISQAVNLLLR